jgi:hypothetical protein
MQQMIFARQWSVLALAVGLAACATGGDKPVAPVGNVVFKADFQKPAAGLADNDEQELAAPIDAPVAVNKNGYAAKLSGKLRVATALGLPPSGTDATWTPGAVQFSNGATPAAQVTITGVQCPFKLVAHHSPTNSSGADRKLRIMFGDKEVYLAGGAVPGVSGIPGYTANLDSATTSSPCVSGKTDVSLYGWNGEKGAGVRIYDIVIYE